MAKSFSEILYSIRKDRMAMVKLKKRYESKRLEISNLFSFIKSYEDLNISTPYDKLISKVTKSVIYGVIKNDYQSKINSIDKNIKLITEKLYELR